MVENNRSGARPKAGSRASADRGSAQLFNLADDLAEEHDLAAWQPEKIQELSKLLNEIRRAGRMPD